MNDPLQNQNLPRRKRLPVLVWVLCGVLLALGIGALIVFGNQGNEQMPEPEATVEIQTAYGTLQFPEVYIAHLHHQETKNGPATAEVFSMTWDGGAQELFRITFGDDEDETPVGYLHTENGFIAVSLQVSQLGREAFPDDEIWTRYQQMRACVDTVLDSITSDERFSEHRDTENEKLEMELSYWTLSLPQGMDCEEHSDGEAYQAIFYGTVGNELWKLYTVSLDDSVETASLGIYLVDGAEKQIHIETEDPAQFDILPEDEKYQAYVYMDSVNDVITAIMESENYVDAVPSGD